MKILIKTIKRFVFYYIVDIIRTWRACYTYEKSCEEFNELVKGLYGNKKS